jgi:Lrp/AsnC family leucine-responsive transcriptional regulator
VRVRVLVRVLVRRVGRGGGCDVSGHPAVLSLRVARGVRRARHATSCTRIGARLMHFSVFQCSGVQLSCKKPYDLREIMPIDDIDRRILREMQRDGRITMAELGAKVGLSSTPCGRRVARLEREGIITGYAAHVDQRALGLPVTVFVGVELADQGAETLARFETAVAGFNEVMECFLMTGSQDFLLRVVARDLDGYERFLQTRLTRIEGIRSIRTRFALRRVSGRPDLPTGD